jgi:hypothetical protein
VIYLAFDRLARRARSRLGADAEPEHSTP